MKKKIINGIIIKNVMPVSFDIRARKKLILPRNNDTIDLVEMYLNMKKIDIIPKRKQKISSRLLILLTTSVCIG